jgi:hypothetical protein
MARPVTWKRSLRRLPVSEGDAETNPPDRQHPIEGCKCTL